MGARSGKNTLHHAGPTPSFLQMRKPHPRRGSGWTITSKQASLEPRTPSTPLGTLHGRRSKQAGKEKDKENEGVRKKKRERERDLEGAKAVKREREEHDSR